MAVTLQQSQLTGATTWHIVSLRHPAAAADQVQAALASQHNISTSSRAGGIRVSLHAYNSSNDIRALASVTPR